METFNLDLRWFNVNENNRDKLIEVKKRINDFVTKSRKNIKIHDCVFLWMQL